MPPPEHATIAVLPEVRETQRVSPAPEPVEYPSSDGKAMAESGWHAVAMVLAHEALQRHFKGREDLYVGIDLLVYYVEGDNTKSLAPDVFVAFGVGSQQRHTYKTWEEGKAPDFVLEVASASTSARDAREKKSLYAQIGVREYWRLDPVGNIMREPLEGYLLERDPDRALQPRVYGDGSEEFWSETLQLGLRVAKHREVTVPVFRDPQTGLDVLTRESLDLALRKAEERAQREEELARRAEELAQQVEELAQQAEDRAKKAEAQVQELLARLANLEH